MYRVASNLMLTYQVCTGAHSPTRARRRHDLDGRADEIAPVADAKHPRQRAERRLAHEQCSDFEDTNAMVRRGPKITFYGRQPRETSRVGLARSLSTLEIATARRQAKSPAPRLAPEDDLIWMALPTRSRL